MSNLVNIFADMTIEVENIEIFTCRKERFNLFCISYLRDLAMKKAIDENTKLANMVSS